MFAQYVWLYAAQASELTVHSLMSMQELLTNYKQQASS